MTQSYLLRVADQTDLAAITELEQSSDPHPWRLSLIEDALQSRKNWLIESNETKTVVGWLTASALFDQSELELIITDKTVRRQGLGKRLLSHWLEWAVGQGCEEGLLEVRESNKSAIALYEQFGFQQVGLRKNYYPLDGGGSEHAVLMTCKLK